MYALVHLIIVRVHCAECVVITVDCVIVGNLEKKKNLNCLMFGLYPPMAIKFDMNCIVSNAYSNNMQCMCIPTFLYKLSNFCKALWLCRNYVNVDEIIGPKKKT